GSWSPGPRPLRGQPKAAGGRCKGDHAARWINARTVTERLDGLPSGLGEPVVRAVGEVVEAAGGEGGVGHPGRLFEVQRALVREFDTRTEDGAAMPGEHHAVGAVGTGGRGGLADGRGAGRMEGRGGDPPEIEDVIGADE